VHPYAFVAHAPETLRVKAPNLAVENDATAACWAFEFCYIRLGQTRATKGGRKVDCMHPFSLDVLMWGGFVLLALLVVLGLVFGRAYLKYRGDRVITCPENRRPAAVAVDTGHVLLMTLKGKTDLRLKSCSRWPEKQDCGQDCLRQIEAAPEDCLVRHILTEWYEGKNCALCGKPIGEIHWADHEPALLSAEHRTVEWHEVAAADVPDVLATHQPVCWNCHVVNRMVGGHPELVLDRSRRI